MHVIDPKAESNQSMSPYVYANNNPVLNIDFMGLSAEAVVDSKDIGRNTIFTPTMYFDFHGGHYGPGAYNFYAAWEPHEETEGDDPPTKEEAKAEYNEWLEFTGLTEKDAPFGVWLIANYGIYFTEEDGLEKEDHFNSNPYAFASTFTISMLQNGIDWSDLSIPIVWMATYVYIKVTLTNESGPISLPEGLVYTYESKKGGLPEYQDNNPENKPLPNVGNLDFVSKVVLSMVGTYQLINSSRPEINKKNQSVYHDHQDNTYIPLQFKTILKYNNKPTFYFKNFNFYYD